MGTGLPKTYLRPLKDRHYSLDPKQIPFSQIRGLGTTGDENPLIAPNEVYTIEEKVSYIWLQRRGKAVNFFCDEGSAGPEREEEAKKLFYALLRHVNLTNEQDQIVDIICQGSTYEITYTEIGRRLGISQQAVTQNYQAILKKCRDLLIWQPKVFDQVWDFLWWGKGKYAVKRREQRRAEMLSPAKAVKGINWRGKSRSLDISFTTSDKIKYSAIGLQINYITKRWEAPEWKKMLVKSLYMEGRRTSKKIMHKIAQPWDSQLF